MTLYRTLISQYCVEKLSAKVKQTIFFFNLNIIIPISWTIWIFNLKISIKSTPNYYNSYIIYLGKFKVLNFVCLVQCACAFSNEIECVLTVDDSFWVDHKSYKSAYIY